MSGIIRKRLPRLEYIHEEFAGIVTTYLSNYLGIRVDFNPISIDYVKLKDLMRSIPIPYHISIDSIPPLNSCSMFNMLDARFVYSLVECILGGYPSRPKVEGRYFSGIENGIVDVVNRDILSCLEKAWSSFIIDFKINHKTIGQIPRFVYTELERDDYLIVVTFEVEFDTCLSMFKTCIPYRNLIRYIPLLCESSNIRCTGSTNEDLKKYLENNKEIKPCNPFTFDSNQQYFSIFKERKCGIGMMLRYELPQTIACIASFLDLDTQVKIIDFVPARTDSQIIFDMIRTIRIPQPDFIPLVDNIINTHYARIANGIEKDTDEDTLLNAIAKTSPQRLDWIREDLEELKKF